jgi:hypothetical protein
MGRCPDLLRGWWVCDQFEPWAGGLHVIRNGYFRRSGIGNRHSRPGMGYRRPVGRSSIFSTANRSAYQCSRSAIFSSDIRRHAHRAYSLLDAVDRTPYCCFKWGLVKIRALFARICSNLTASVTRPLCSGPTTLPSKPFVTMYLSGVIDVDTRLGASGTSVRRHRYDAARSVGYPAWP